MILDDSRGYEPRKIPEVGSFVTIWDGAERYEHSSSIAAGFFIISIIGMPIRSRMLLTTQARS